DSSEEVAVLRHEGDVYAVALSPDGTRLATGSADGTARLWDAGSGEDLDVLRHEDVVRSVVFSPDGTRLATGSEDYTARLWDASSGEELAVLRHEDWVYQVVFSPDGTRLATGSYDGTARLWDPDSGGELAVLRHEAEVRSVAFSPDGTQLATGSADGTARLWDPDSGGELAVLRHGDEVYQVFFSPDGTRLVTGSEDGTARLWRVHPEDLATSACDIVNRNLTKDEWRQYLGDRPYRPTCPSLPVHPSVTRSLLDEGIGLAQKGEVEGAIAQFEEALELDPSLEIDAQTWKDLCWFGSLWGHSAVVLSACEQAVTLAPHDGDIHDCRGLARALTGDSKGAREDFEFYVDWLKQGGQHKPGGNGREAWIAELDAGENPFDEATLEDLRGQ
ncbi:MAG TPA: hypothetical protein VLY63_14300, partial [Anaerolineae bacterium]|nr:hypothetical protein [Anaerolineae bacterium]